MPAPRLRIMIVDDHAAFRRTVRTVLRATPAEFLECEDGLAAVACYAEFRPDWVLMDIAMKPLDGLSATAQLKRRYPLARIVIVTQYDDAELRAAARRAGASDYVLKDDLSRLPQLVQPVGGEPAAEDVQPK